MNILIATDVFPPKSGGSGWSTFHLARALQKRGHRVEIALPKLGAPPTQTRVYEGLNVVEVGYNASDLPGLRAWQGTRALEKNFGSYLAERAREFDLIHAQHILSISAAVAAKKITPVPVVSTVRDYWAVCLYGTLWRDNAICPICRGSERTKCLAQKYGTAAQFMLPALPLVQRELVRRQRTLQESDAVIAVSGFVAGTLRGVVKDENLRVVPNLVDPDEINAQISKANSERVDSVGLDALAGDLRNGEQLPKGSTPVPTNLLGIRSSLQSPVSPPYLMFIGKLNSLKGADLLPEILAKSGVEMPLVVAGEGEYVADLKRCKGIVMRGWLANIETLALLKGAIALVFPSRWAEPLARTLLEAQALGVPTIALNSGGTRDIIEHGFNGLLAENIDQFSDYVRTLTLDTELRSRLGENAKQVALARFSPDIVAGQLEQVYAAVVRRQPSSVLPS